MAEGWRVAEMILTVQIAEEMRLAAQTIGQSPASRTVVLNFAKSGNPSLQVPARVRKVRFGAFEADLHSGELRKQGVKIKLHDQPFQVLP